MLGYQYLKDPSTLRPHALVVRSRTLCLLGYQYLKDPSTLRPPALVVRSRTLRLLGYQTSTLDISQLLVSVLVAGISINISFFN